MIKYEGGCLCGSIAFTAKSEPINPHLCSCTTCQRSSGAPTVAWVEFSLEHFEWKDKNELGLYRSSEKTQRFFCKRCGSFMGTINDGYANISIVIVSLKNANSIIPGKQHSYKESGHSWWEVNIIARKIMNKQDI